jgi:hypothetical protein
MCSVAAKSLTKTTRENAEMTTYYTASPNNLPIATATAVANPDGTFAVIAGGASLAAASALNRNVKVNVVTGSDMSVSAAACDIPGLTGTPTAAQIAALVMAETVQKGNPLSGVPDSPNYSGESAGAFGLFKNDPGNVVRRVRSLQG